jgi:cytochrome c biogenesis protein CcmG/thiol:disulfide interchange protein DsbE
VKRRFRYLIGGVPLVFVIGLLVALWAGLSHQPSIIPSPLIGRSAPPLTLPRLAHPGRQVTRAVFEHHVTLLNVWASWCVSCEYEHPTLLWLKRHGVRIIGLDYKDHRAPALAYLKKHGNPYVEVAYDRKGLATINWGVYGTPETFVLGPRGHIRYKYVGPIPLSVARRTILPLVQRLRLDETRS